MKTIFLCFVVLISNTTIAQKAKVAWSEEIKFQKAQSDMEVVAVDNTGIYIKEFHLEMSMGFGGSVGKSASLLKLDKNLTKLYDVDFDKITKDKDFKGLFHIKNKLLLSAIGFEKKSKSFVLSVIEINKSNGTKMGDWQPISNWFVEDKDTPFRCRVSPNADNSGLILVSVSDIERSSAFEVRMVDSDFKEVLKPVTIKSDTDPKTFELEDVVITGNGNIVLVGMNYQYGEAKKQKLKPYEFKNYNIRLYNNGGKFLKEINTSITDKIIVGAKVVEAPSKELIMVGFYANAVSENEINGLVIKKVNAETGEIINTNQKAFPSLAAVTKSKTEPGLFTKFMKVPKILFTEDKGLVVLAEKNDSYIFDETGTSINGGIETVTYRAYVFGDLIASKIDAGGNISWLQIIPKNQKDILRAGFSTSTDGSGIDSRRYFTGTSNFPFYTSFGVAQSGNKIGIVFNDAKENIRVTNTDQKAIEITKYNNSGGFAISLDAVSGNYTKSLVFSNDDKPIAMPRSGAASGNEFFLVGKEIKLIGNVKILVGKLTF